MARVYDPNESAGSAEAKNTLANRGSHGQIIRRPILLGEEENKEGVYGFGADLYCPRCEGKFDFILVEFENSSEGSSLAWGEINLDDFDVDLLKCPRCGYRELEPL